MSIALPCPAKEVLPHRAPMLVIDTIESWQDDHLVCAVSHKASGIFCDTEGKIPIWLGLEYMCQSSAALEGLRRRSTDEDLPYGVFLGTKRFSAYAPYFDPSVPVKVHVEESMANTKTLAVYDCRIISEQGKLLARAMIKAASAFDIGTHTLNANNFHIAYAAAKEKS